MKKIVLISGLLMAFLSVPSFAAPPGEGKARSDYILNCSGCHGMAGLGTIDGGIPTFPNSVGYIAATEIGRDYLLQVPGVISTAMSDEEVAEVLNYILEYWGKESDQKFTGEEVTMRRATPHRDVVQYRREVVEVLRKSGIEIAEYPWP